MPAAPQNTFAFDLEVIRQAADRWHVRQEKRDHKVETPPPIPVPRLTFPRRVSASHPETPSSTLIAAVLDRS